MAIQDENDWTPQWKKLEYFGEIMETAAVNDLVFEQQQTNNSSILPRANYMEKKRQRHGMSSRFSKNKENRGHFRKLLVLNNYQPLAVKAADRDVGANSRVFYSMASLSYAASFFKIDPLTGE